jgi:ribosome biogenesis GTPase
MKPLEVLGWNESFQQAWDDGDNSQGVPGRVIAEFGSSYKVAIPEERSAEVSGRLEYLSEPHELPKVGDWVVVQPLDDEHAIIHGVLPRASEIGRKRPGEQFAKQVLAANVDIAFLVQALDRDFSPERLRRYLFQLKKEAVTPIVVLNKADKESDIESKLRELASFDIRVLVTSALQQEGVSEVADAIPTGKTAVFLGSSGVGKSTITNLLLGTASQATQSVRAVDSRGRHTTTHRELFILPNGGLVIDTPGLRELQLWGTEDDLDGVFADIEALVAQCRFRNCTHANEPGCAVQQALETGSLEPDRFESYVKFQKELRYLSTKVDAEAAFEHKQQVRKTGRYYKQVIKGKNELKGR